MKKITPDYDNIYKYIEQKKLDNLLKYIKLKYSFEDHLASQIKKNFYNDRTTL